MQIQKYTATFLGTGTSTGVPMIACDCNICYSKDKKNKRSRASFYIQSKEFSFVIDTGPDFRYQFLRENITTLDAVIYSHAHMDHISGFDDIRRFCVDKNHKPRLMPIYATENTQNAIKKAFSYAFNPKKNLKNYVKPLLKKIHPNKKFSLGPFTINTIPVEHGDIDTIGIQISTDNTKITYISDCKSINPKYHEYIKNSDYLIIGALHHPKHPTHQNIEEATNLAQKLKPKQTFFTHMSHLVDYKKIKLPKNIAFAFDGQKIHF